MLLLRERVRKGKKSRVISRVFVSLVCACFFFFDSNVHICHEIGVLIQVRCIFSLAMLFRFMGTPSQHGFVLWFSLASLSYTFFVCLTHLPSAQNPSMPSSCFPRERLANVLVQNRGLQLNGLHSKLS